MSTPVVEGGLDPRGVRAIVDAGEPRPDRAGTATVVGTFFLRAMLKIRRVPEQLTDVLVLPVVGTLLFTYLFGGAIAGSSTAYLQYLLPGALVQTVLLITPSTGFVLNQDVGSGVFDRFRTLPIWRPAPLVGAMLGDVVRYAVAGAAVVGLGLALGYRPDGGVSGVLAAVGLLLVFCFAVSWIWTFVGLVVRSSQAVMGVSMGLVFVLTFVSNVFVDPATMPTVVRAVVEVNPVTLLVTAERGLMAGTASAGDVAAALAVSAALVAVFAPLTMRRYARAA